MSIETNPTGKPSHCVSGEGCQEQSTQPLKFAQRSGGVGGDSMSGRGTEETRETCSRGVQTPTGGTTSATEKAARARAGVGVLHSSEEVPVTGMERRRGSCAGANGAVRTRRWPERDSNTHETGNGLESSESVTEALPMERKEIGEQHSESRMREIRTSGSMRGREVGGQWPLACNPVTSFPTLPQRTEGNGTRLTAMNRYGLISAGTH